MQQRLSSHDEIDCSTSPSVRTVVMPEGVYTLRSLSDGHWAVRPPGSTTWYDGYADRCEASIAIARQDIPQSA